jgi:hydroxylamine reductase (hybrid-cluster protein)
MFCYQCEETNKVKGCKINGICGKNIILSPKVPSFLSKNVLNVLVENFNIMQNTNIDNNLKNLKFIA